MCTQDTSPKQFSLKRQVFPKFSLKTYLISALHSASWPLDLPVHQIKLNLK